MNKDKIYQMAINKWGKELQIVMGIEEMAELTKALVKSLRKPDDNNVRKNIVEEIADVQIMIGQLKRIYVLGNGEELNEVRRKKMLRLEKMLQSDLLNTDSKKES